MPSWKAGVSTRNEKAGPTVTSAAMSSTASRKAIRSCASVPYSNRPRVNEAMPSLPGGSCIAGTWRTRPKTETVWLTCSGWTISRNPLGSTLTSGGSPGSGTCGVANAAAAQVGSVTGWSGGESKFSAPPKPDPATFLPAARGVRIAVTAWSGSSN